MLRTWQTALDSDSDSDAENRARTAPRAAASPALSASSSEESDAIHEPISTVCDTPRTVELRERSSSPPRRFRARDPHTNTKLFTIGGEQVPGDLSCVRCRSGAPLWRIQPAPHPRTRILRKYGSPYYIALGATQWARHLERRAHGYVHAAPHLKRSPALAIEVRGDALGKLFRVLGIDGNNTLSLATCRRSTKFVPVDGVVREVSRWTLHIEKNVDCTMIAAVVAVLEEWSTVGPQNSERRRPKPSTAKVNR